MTRRVDQTLKRKVELIDEKERDDDREKKKKQEATMKIIFAQPSAPLLSLSGELGFLHNSYMYNIDELNAKIMNALGADSRAKFAAVLPEGQKNIFLEYFP